MWSIDINSKGEFYLTYDRERRFNHYFRGRWELIGPTYHYDTQRCIEVNRQAGYYCLPDDEGNTRILVLEE